MVMACAPRLAACLMLLASVVAAQEEQPGALDVYPPTHNSTFMVPLDHFAYHPSRAGSIELGWLAYDGFVTSPNATVLLYLGNEGAAFEFYNASGGIFEMADALGDAWVVFVEHRYYGSSLPFGPEASFTSEGLQWLTVEQAMADDSLFIAALPELLGCSGKAAQNVDRNRCDVVTFGGSYGGMLVGWHRQKYPHLTVGAIASGASVDFYPARIYDDETIYTRFVDAYRETFSLSTDNTTETPSTDCGQIMTSAFALLEGGTVTPVDLGLAGVQACDGALDGPSAVERFAFYARGALSTLAMLDYPVPANFIAPLPANPVETACTLLAEARHQSTTDPMALISGLLDVTQLLVNGTGGLPCLDLDAELVGSVPASRPSSPRRSEPVVGTTSWNYQACTELLLEPITSDGFGFHPPAPGRQTREVVDNCAAVFNGTISRPLWFPLALGVGADFCRWSTNIVYMENSKDPWHVGTQSLESECGLGGDLSGEAVNARGGTVVRVVAQGGGHHQDLRFTSEYDAPDVVAAREFELRAVRMWLAAA